MALQKGQRLREVGQFEVAEVGQIKSAGDKGSVVSLQPQLRSRKQHAHLCDVRYQAPIAP
ncbi:hypothetical protein XcvCFBP7113P_06470 [Xanthomonas citri pv. vignicola]|nr:hypothetical protein XcvCFBP7113P_06470 [Xanthomonas citri pv. vignicola]